LNRPPPPSADTAAAATAGISVEIPAIVEQPPTSTPNEPAVGASTAGTVGPPVLDVQTNPELPSPARVRWMDAFSRVCAHLNQVTQSFLPLLLYFIIITFITPERQHSWA